MIAGFASFFRACL